MPDGWNPFSKKGSEGAPNPEAKNDPASKSEPTPAELIAASVAEAIKPLVESNTALASRLEAVETSVKRPAKAEVSEGEPQVASVFDDEDRAFAQRIGPVLQMQLDTNAKIALGEVKAEFVTKGYGDMLVKYEEEISNILNNSPLLTGDGKPCRGDKVYIRNVINMVVGREAISKGLKFDGRDRGFFIESAGGDGGNSPALVDDGLSPEQRKVFSRMGIKPDDAKKTMAKLKFVS